MKKHSTVSSIRNNVLYLLLLICLAVAGCAGMSPAIPDERRIPLIQTENNQGDFKNGPLTLKYSYSLTGSSLSSGGSNMILAGKATYRGGFDSLDIRILFLDGAGSVLQRKFIYSSGYRNSTDKVSDRAFQKTFVVPAGSEAITFTYSVQERSGRE